MTTKSITATFNSPFPTYRWQFRYTGNTPPEEGDSVPDVYVDWQDLTDTNYGDETTGYVPGDQEPGDGRLTRRIWITSPQQDRDEAYFRCIASSVDGKEQASGEVLIFIGELEWVVNLPEETKNVAQTP